MGRGLRSAEGKDRCIVIDVSSNWSTFGPVEKLEWSLWDHRKSYVRYKNRFNWIGEQLEQGADEKIYFLCENKLPQWSSVFAYLQKKVNTLMRNAVVWIHDSD